MVNILEDLTSEDQAAYLAYQIFEEGFNIIYDASALHTFDKYLHKNRKISLKQLDIAKKFIHTFNSCLSESGQRFLTFPELYKEHHARIDSSKKEIKNIFKIKRNNKFLHEKLEEFYEELNIFDELLKELGEKKTELYEKADKFLNLILYLNDRYSWKKYSAKNVDESIISLGIVATALSGPTKVYSLDKELQNLLEKSSKILTADQLYLSEQIKHNYEAKDFLRQFRQTKLLSFRYCSYAKYFVEKMNNQNDERKTSEDNEKFFRKIIDCSDTKEYLIDYISDILFKVMTS
ncbi:hypothetical protein KY314_04970 [Candidatus Woesearchaeota archaeon]|nr:hypothetical protein [Candidatus Woesearchaeota archaeon]